jgi:hypothetical protein
MREAAAAVRHLEQAVLGAEWTEGIVVKHGGMYLRVQADTCGAGVVSRAGGIALLEMILPTNPGVRMSPALPIHHRGRSIQPSGCALAKIICPVNAPT